jgi:asparagine synthase (glutamine-hydrolysing)
MCGVFGIVRMTGISEADRVTLRCLADASVHRGPDGEGFCVDQSVAMGMRRLSIIDLAGGWQPLLNEDESIVVVANGEIYNFVEARKSLEARGHRFVTGSDCEVIVHLYEEYGDQCVERMHGMFSFALLDKRQGRFLLVRDRVGEKPMHVVDLADGIVFSSELTPLVSAGVVDGALSADAIKMYYHWGFVPEPATPVIGVRKLPAATIMSMDLRTGVRKEHVYWRPEMAPGLSGDAVEQVGNAIEDTFRMLVRSDVPIAVGLSGGIDSSAVLSYACKHANQPITAVSIGYSGNAWQDESGEAEQFARSIGVRFHRAVLDEESMLNEFPKMCRARDEPIANLTGVSIYSLMRRVRDLGCPVFLSGLGGDELFWGYAWHRAATTASLRKQRLRDGHRQRLADYLQMTPPPISRTGLINWIQDLGGLAHNLRQFNMDRVSDPDRLAFWDQKLEYQQASSLLAGIAGGRLLEATCDPAAPFTGPDYWQDVRASMVERLMATYLRSDGLGQTDRLSMACSVESRTPLVDYRLVETVFGLRREHDDLNLGHKAWLRSVFGEILPETVLRRKKRGFSTPGRRWASLLSRKFGPRLLGGALVTQGILRNDAIRSLVMAFDRFGRVAPFILESIMLEEWARGIRDKISQQASFREREPIAMGITRR